MHPGAAPHPGVSTNSPKEKKGGGCLMVGRKQIRKYIVSRRYMYVACGLIDEKYAGLLRPGLTCTCTSSKVFEQGNQGNRIKTS